MPTDPSFKPPRPTPGLVREPHTTGMGDDRGVLRVPCSRGISHFLNSFPLISSLVRATVTPGKLHGVTILKPLLWLVNFDPPLVLNVGRWLIKNTMLMGYILGGLFQTVEQFGNGTVPCRPHKQ